jgi:hypothetical protein
MSADYPGPLSIDRSSVTRQVKRAHPLIDRNAIYPMIPPRGIGDGGRSMVAKLERVALREALPQRVVECAALEMRHRCKPIGGSNPSLFASKSLIHQEKIHIVKLCGDFRGLAAELTAVGH